MKVKVSNKYICPTCKGFGIEQIDNLQFPCEDCNEMGIVTLSEQRLKQRCDLIARTCCSYPQILHSCCFADFNIFQDIEEKTVLLNICSQDRKYYLECGSLRDFYRRCYSRPQSSNVYEEYPPIEI